MRPNATQRVKNGIPHRLEQNLQFGIDRQWEDVVARNPSSFYQSENVLLDVLGWFPFAAGAMVIPDHHDSRPWPTCKRTQRNISAANDTGILHRVDDVLDLDRRQTAPLHPAIDDGLDKPTGVLIGKEQYKLGRFVSHYRTPVVKTSAS